MSHELEWIRCALTGCFPVSCISYGMCVYIEIGWPKILRLFLKRFQRTIILPMGFTISNKMALMINENSGSPGTKLKFFSKNLKILSPYVQSPDSSNSS